MNIFQLLVSPEKKLPLYFNKTNETLVSDEGEFQIINGIPILLPIGKRPNYVIHYTKDAEVFNYFEERFKETESEEKRVHQFVLSKVPPKARLITDVGCGKGWLARHLLNMNRTVVSIDISLKNVKKVIETYSDEKHFGVVADGYFLPFKADSFDCVVASEVIEHLEQPQNFIAELIRVTKVNGKIILTTPYKEKIRYTLCIHCNNPTPLNAHLHSFDEQNLDTILKNFVDIIKWKYYKFGNSLIQYLRLYRILSIIPFSIWKIIDFLLNLIFPPKHILIEITKIEDGSLCSK